MIVYVETNFVLEISREQEQAVAAKKILALVEENKIVLAFPNFALSEPFSTIIRQRKDRQNLLRSLRETLGQLRRSETHQQTTNALEPVLHLLQAAIERDLDLLHSTVESLLKVGRSLEMDVNSFQQAMAYQKQLGLSPQDSIIFATIVADLKQQTKEAAKCFLSRDKKAFATTPRIEAELKSYNCKYINLFTDGLVAIEHILQKGE